MLGRPEKSPNFGGQVKSDIHILLFRSNNFYDWLISGQEYVYVGYGSSNQFRNYLLTNPEVSHFLQLIILILPKQQEDLIRLVLIAQLL